MSILFWTSLFLLCLVYLLYPVIVAFLSVIANRNFVKDNSTPSIQIVIAAYNEEAHIAEKIENTLTLNYPKNKMQVIVGSDGSTDNTVSIVKKYEKGGVKLIDFKVNKGKTSVQNACVEQSESDIIIFMDAASLCEPDALTKLVGNFADPRVGVVAGRVLFTTAKDTMITSSQNTYWSYEIWLKSCESKLGALVGVDGPLYAIRRPLYKTLHHALISDFITPLQVRQQGYAVVLERDARTYEFATEHSNDELSTRKRITVRALNSLFRYQSHFNPFASPLLMIQILIRKLLRWTGGILFAGVILSSAFQLTNPFYFTVFNLSILFIIVGIFATFFPYRKAVLLKIPFYFLLVHLAGILGLIEFIRGKQIINWIPVRQKN